MKINRLHIPFGWVMQKFDGNGRKTPTFKQVILWQAKTELRTATSRHPGTSANCLQQLRDHLRLEQTCYHHRLTASLQLVLLSRYPHVGVKLTCIDCICQYRGESSNEMCTVHVAVVTCILNENTVNYVSVLTEVSSM